MLARGLSNYELALAYFAKRESSSGGRQMPGHYSSRVHNVVSVCTPTGGGLIPAAGTAWGMTLKGKDSVVVATVGDAASRQGEFFEAWAFAVQENLPLIVVLEDNKFGISTPTEKFMALNMKGILSEERVVKVDGRRVDSVLSAGQAAIDKARRGEGPTLLWMDIDRLSSHTSSDDHRVYRDPVDIEAMAKRDPIVLLRDQLIASGELTLEDYDRLLGEVTRQVDEDYLRAEKAQDPLAEEVMAHCWGEEVVPEAPPLEPGSQTMVESINRVFDKALERDPDVIFFGEDIEDPKGGVFGLTKGLSAKFPKQVFNSPLAEATIVGVAVGLCAYGMKPVFEIQFIDFLAPAWNQLVTNVSSLRWRTFGEYKCPVTFYAPYGAYLPGGSLWHSHSNEASLAHVPGIKVAIPSTPEDAAGIFWSAIHGNDPSFILIPKHIFRKRATVEAASALGFGKARVATEGSQVTLITWGNTLELAEEAAAATGISVEIIDLRSIVPVDYELIEQSLEKTGRLVIVQEDTRTCGMAPSLAGEVVSRPELFSLLLSAPQVVSRPDVHIGYNPIYEYAALPSVEDVSAALRAALS
jgi:2-oxoisovalerate dehydrogenase E1 component